jgi:hypothetical protein
VKAIRPVLRQHNTEHLLDGLRRLARIQPEAESTLGFAHRCLGDLHGRNLGSALMRSGLHNRTRDRGREPIRINGGGNCPPVLPEPGRGRSLKGALEARGILTRLSVRRHRGCFLNAFVLAAKATIGRACEGAGHAQRHQKLAVGIDADALGGLCQLAKLPDALRSGARLRMCTIHDGESELGRLPLLRKSFPAPTARALEKPRASPCLH